MRKSSILSGMALIGGATFWGCSAPDSEMGDRSGGKATSGEADAVYESGSDASLSIGALGSSDVGGENGGAGAGGASNAPAAVDSPEPKTVPAGALTAGMFDDNLSFTFFESYRDRVLQGNFAGLMPLEWSDFEIAHELYLKGAKPKSVLDLSLIIDTTGSMGDELGYLKSEFASIADSITKNFPNADPRWSLVLYRDHGDEYVTRSFDFIGDSTSYQTTLNQQGYGGGGDYPEAPDAALQTAAELDWRGHDSVAKIAFWVADAPHHNENASAMAAAVSALQQQDVHVYPVASSGVDEMTEFSMRSVAQQTQGRYLFLTDDSGLGDSHKEPTVPCYYVTTLSTAILRSVRAEMTGAVTAPQGDALIRVGGTLNTEGACYYGNGTEAWPF